VRIAPATLFLTSLLLVSGLSGSGVAVAQDHSFRIGIVKYGGGGDWYEGITPLPPFLRYVREHTTIDVALQADVVELTSDQVFSYPFIFITGHGNIEFTHEEVTRLRRYLEGGGFLYVDDDYGMDPYIRRELRKVFPEQDLVELAFDHPIYHVHYSFPDGLPKVHEHDGKPPQGFGLFDGTGRLCVFYTYETNISDGWEEYEVHGNPREIREMAQRMGVNILVFALTQ
jgi:hypothetical protein